MNKEQRERAKAVAKAVAGKIPNGPTSGDLRRASLGENEDLLLAIHLILSGDHA